MPKGVYQRKKKVEVEEPIPGEVPDSDVVAISLRRGNGGWVVRTYLINGDKAIITAESEADPKTYAFDTLMRQVHNYFWKAD